MVPSPHPENGSTSLLTTVPPPHFWGGCHYLIPGEGSTASLLGPVPLRTPRGEHYLNTRLLFPFSPTCTNGYTIFASDLVLSLPATLPSCLLHYPPSYLLDCLLVCLPAFLPACLSICQPTYRHTYVPDYLPTCLTVRLCLLALCVQKLTRNVSGRFFLYNER